jgi:hypothetical protein
MATISIRPKSDLAGVTRPGRPGYRRGRRSRARLRDAPELPQAVEHCKAILAPDEFVQRPPCREPALKPGQGLLKRDWPRRYGQRAAEALSCQGPGRLPSIEVLCMRSDASSNRAAPRDLTTPYFGVTFQQRQDFGYRGRRPGHRRSTRAVGLLGSDLGRNLSISQDRRRLC